MRVGVQEKIGTGFAGGHLRCRTRVKGYVELVSKEPSSWSLQGDCYHCDAPVRKFLRAPESMELQRHGKSEPNWTVI